MKRRLELGRAKKGLAAAIGCVCLIPAVAAKCEQRVDMKTYRYASQDLACLHKSV